ncbi:MAG: glycosyltransferase family 4 protein [Actinomycetota bacterium]|nr:glycosyltransferase family 4 protein [Actinomycetota bacterium]
MKVAVLTTSYPRWPGDAAGHFVLDGVERLRAAGVEVDVVSPQSFSHYGIAYGSGVVANIRERPTRALLVPLMLARFRRAAAGPAAEADLVHAHWWPTGLVAMSLKKPFVVQLWGTDVEVARRAPRLARAVLRRARVVVCASNSLADVARGLDARDVRVIPNGVEIPAQTAEEERPPHVLYAGRLSREKGILELVDAADGLPLVVVGDGPLRDRVPGSLGMVPNDELGGYYDRAAVIAVPSHREGFGVVCAEAMAHGRPVVAGAVGGLLDLVQHEETGLLVPPGDVPALRSALKRLLDDPDLRARYGAAARERMRNHFSWERYTELMLDAYAVSL